MAFLDFVRSQIGTNPLSPIQKFLQVLQAGAQNVQSSQPKANDLTPMASGQLNNPLKQFIDAVQPGAQGTSRVPLVNIGPGPAPQPSPSPNLSQSSVPSTPSLEEVNKQLGQIAFPTFLGQDRSTGVPRLPDSVRARYLSPQSATTPASPFPVSQPVTRATTPEERLSAPAYQPPAWITELSSGQGQLAAKDPQTAMRFVLANSGLATEGPLGDYFLQRAPAIANLYQVQSGAFLDDGTDPRGLMTYMQAWVDKMTASTASEGQRRFSDNMKQQTAAKADEVLHSTAEGTPGWAFRQAVDAEIAESQGRQNEFKVYWGRLIEPTLVAKRLSERTINAQFEIVSDYYADYQMEQFAGTFAGDFGTYLVERGYRLSSKS